MTDLTQSPDTSVQPFADGGVGDLMTKRGYAYLEDYVLSLEGPDHEPTEFERMMLEDFMNGLLTDEAMFAPVRSLLADMEALKTDLDLLETDRTEWQNRAQAAEARATALEERVRGLEEALRFYRDAWIDRREMMISPLAQDERSATMGPVLSAWREPSDSLKDDGGNRARLLLTESKAHD